MSKISNSGICGLPLMPLALAAVLLLAMTSGASALWWNGTMSVSVSASDPPAAASNPPNQNSNFSMESGADTRHSLPADGSWYKATSAGPLQGTEAGAKAKAGLKTEDGKDKVVVKADTYIKDPRDGDLKLGNGGDNGGSASASACMSGYLSDH